MRAAKVLFLSVAAGVAGCITAGVAPTAAQLAAADYGAQPNNYQAAIQRYFDSTLKDPSSIQYRELTVPEKGYMQRHSIAEGTRRNFGWMVKATINAKNAYGGYVGFQTYSFLFRGEEIVDMILPDE